MRSIYDRPGQFLVLVFVIAAFVPASHASELTLAVANSTCNAIKRVGESFMQKHDVKLTYICKSSGRLAKGLKGKAISADIYVSANRAWMDFMIENELAASRLVTSPWGNSLKLAVPVNSSLNIEDWNELANDRVKTILLGDPSTAPFGRYAKQALESTGLWKAVRGKVRTKKHITLLAETLADADNYTVGILFKSNVSDKLRVIYSLDKNWHEAIRYYIAPVGGAADNELATDFLIYVQGADAQKIFREEQFEMNTK